MHENQSCKPTMLSKKAVEQTKRDCRVSNSPYATGYVTGRRGTDREYLVSPKGRGTEDQESENAKSKRHHSRGDNQWAR